MRRFAVFSLAIVLALTCIIAGSVSARSTQEVVQVRVDHATTPLERAVTLDIQVPVTARSIRLVYEQMSFDLVHSIQVPVMGKDIRVVIPAEHTTQPGIRYWWEVDAGSGAVRSEETVIPFIDDMDIMSVGTYIAHDMNRAGGKLPNGVSVPSGRGRIPHNLSTSVAPVSSKTLEVRNISTSYVHRGLDFSMTEGRSIVAMEAGVVHASAFNSGGWGHYVMLRHDNSNYYTLYAHLQSRTVSQNQTVSKGQEVGKSGNTGSSTGPHLHTAYHVYVSGARVELYPFRYFMGSFGGYPAEEFDYVQVPVNGFDYNYGSFTRANVYGKGSGSPWVKIVWRRKGTSTWTESNMSLISGTNNYRYWWDPSHDGRTMEYYIKAGKSTVTTTHWVTRPAKFHSGNPGIYYEITVQRGAVAAMSLPDEPEM